MKFFFDIFQPHGLNRGGCGKNRAADLSKDIAYLLIIIIKIKNAMAKTHHITHSADYTSTIANTTDFFY